MPIEGVRKPTKMIHVGDVPIGGGAPIAVQSMTNTDTRDVVQYSGPNRASGGRGMRDRSFGHPR